MIDIQMDITQLIGIGASIGTGISLLPQLIKIIREKKAEQLSMGMMAVLLTGLILWIIYGVSKDDWIIILSNAVSLLLNVAIILLSIKYKKESH
ncbi:SemiSWEET family sugar transporter [Paraflavitalea pollutisoli]|uniref:SemiSWEET family sugar transporter n=1 Tax=Paraflavitalea pollutisoli TaxID=3034143 RepID=UPI0023EA88D0|nr:SemiSWEET transporter [Paraflavitalea sp. H1-2-19X]